MRGEAEILTKRDIQILSILYKAGRPLRACDIVEAQDDLVPATVMYIVRKLLEKGLLDAEAPIKTNKKPARRYVPNQKAEELIREYFLSQYRMFSDVITPEELYEDMKKGKSLPQ